MSVFLISSVVLVGIFCLFLCSLASADPLKEGSKVVLGKDWLVMSQLEKGKFVFDMIETLRTYDVPVAQSPLSYTSWMDEKVVHDSKALSVDAVTLFEAIVYEYEPQCRASLEKIGA